MRLVFGLVLVLGLGLAGFAVYMAKSYIQGYQNQLALERAQRAPQIETVEVLVAKTPLKFGQKIQPDSVRLVKFPKEAVPAGVFRTMDALFPEGEQELRAVRRAMEANEAILAVKVTAPGEDAGISSQLAPGMRAFAIKVDVASGVSGFLRPGDRVDVYWTGQVRGGSDVRTEGNSMGDVTKLIETGVQLIAVDQISDENTSQAIIARTVTVAAKPQQVAALAQAQATGRLALSLVGTDEESVAEVIEVDQRRLLGLSRLETAPAPQRQEVCTIRTRRGAEVIISQIPCTN